MFGLRRRVEILSLLACLAGACGDDGGDDDEGGGSSGESGGYCAESASVVMCEGDTNCAFDPAMVDCSKACPNIDALCKSGCAGDEAGCQGFTVDNCMTACNFVKNQACPNVTFGCYAMSSDCDTVGECVDQYR